MLTRVLTAATCDRLLQAASADSEGPTFVDVDDPAVTLVCEYLEAANALQWGFPRYEWSCKLATYGVGGRFPLHTDYDPGRGPGATAFTYAATVLLSDPDSFTGGDLLVDGQPAPRVRGGASAFGGLTPHEVTPITSGQRVALIVFATYGCNAEAQASGWPERWLSPVSAA